ncbi:MAG: phosphocholine cytidylyltransferase family protein [Flavobacteriaceae bacterium]|nr:phosphocholine cytidylyltransferase family protein [Flavobacteriaceae bacterium]
MNINLKNQYDGNRISTALLLAAGTGSRLFPLTKNSPKCLTIVSEKSILERLVNNLKKQGFKRLVIVTGYKKECIIDFLGDQSEDLSIEYIHSPLYRTTNNIYSLWMARNIINEPFVLLESDLILTTSLLNEMVYPDRMAVAKMQPWLNGTTVTVNKLNQVTHFQSGTTEPYIDIRYKTVNIYSFSLSSWRAIVKKLDQYISDGSINCYYEAVFSEMVEDKSLFFEAVSFDEKAWYEIDTINDLAEAEKLFPLEFLQKTTYKDSSHVNTKKTLQLNGKTA